MPLRPARGPVSGFDKGGRLRPADGVDGGAVASGQASGFPAGRRIQAEGWQRSPMPGGTGRLTRCKAKRAFAQQGARCQILESMGRAGHDPGVL